MAASEIDDIFSGKSKLKTTSSTETKKRKAPEEGLASSSNISSEPSQRKKKKKKKNGGAVQSVEDELKEDEEDTSKKDRPREPKSGKGRTVETVLDTSSKATSKDTTQPARQGKKSKVGRSSEADDMKRFQDSRGSAPRQRTEEGYLVYKEEELGIGGGGGDTPLCPFDCECCF